VTVRQLGCHENNNVLCNPESSGGLRALHVHVFDVGGNPIGGAQVTVRLDGGSTWGPAETGTTDVAFPSYLQLGLDGTMSAVPYSDYMEVRVSHAGVSSDWSPILWRNVIPEHHFYSWELFFVYIPDTVTFSATYAFTPLEHSYNYSHVEINTSSGIVNDPPEYDYESDDRQTIGTAAINTYSQTFIPEGNLVIAAKAFVTTNHGFTARYRASIHEGGPSGPQIGATRVVHDYWSIDYPKVSVFWPMSGPGSVPVVPGQTYALKVTKEPENFTGASYSLYTSITDSNPEGDLYRDGVLVSPLQDMVGMVITADATYAEGTPTPPQTGVEKGWKTYY
jgi:hypothetical protein